MAQEDEEEGEGGGRHVHTRPDVGPFAVEKRQQDAAGLSLCGWMGRQTER